MIIERIIGSFPVQAVVWALVFVLSRSNSGVSMPGLAEPEGALRS